MNTSIKRALSGTIASILAIGGSIVPAFAAAGGTNNAGPGNTTNDAQSFEHHPNTNDMGVWVDKDSEGIEKGGKAYNKVVTPLGKNAFYRFKNYTEPAHKGKTAGVTKHVVEYAVGDDKSLSDCGDAWKAIPSEYINNNFANDSLYGAYVVENGEGGKPQVVFVKLDECVLGDDGSYTFNHATADGALVSGKVDTATSEKPHMGTDFYIRVDDELPPPPETERLEPDFGRADKWVSYDITVAIETKYKMEATIPMYVCMYGYRETGEVVTPKKEQYVMKNYSSVCYGENAYIKDVVKNTIYTPIVDKNHSFENLFLIAYAEDKDQYMWFYGEPTVKDINDGFQAIGSAARVTGADADLYAGKEPFVFSFDSNGDHKVDSADKQYVTAAGEMYVSYDFQKAAKNPAATRDDLWSFKANGVLTDIKGEDGKTYRGTRESFMVLGNDGKTMVPGVDPNHPLNETFVHDTIIGNGSGDKVSFTFTTTPKVGDKTVDQKAKDEALAINVSKIQASPASWKLVDFGKQNMQAGEIAMKIAPDFANKDVSAIGLEKCSAPVDITARGWNVPAPAMASDNTVDHTKPGELPLITMARMAGNRVNPIGCTKVVHVEYTISPIDKIGDPQINTDTGVGGDVDHLPETPAVK